MSGAQNKTPAIRYKLIKTYFYILREAGISEDDGHAVVESLYGKASLRLLTTDELKRVVDELVLKTGIELRKPLPKLKAKIENVIVTKNGIVIELPTRDQLAIIEFHADKMNISQETLQYMIMRAGGNQPLSLLSARTLIEALKAMYARGWKDKSVEKKQTAGARDN